MTRVAIGSVVLVQFLVAAFVLLGGLRELAVVSVGASLGVYYPTTARTLLFSYMGLVGLLGCVATPRLGRHTTLGRRLVLVHMVLVVH